MYVQLQQNQQKCAVSISVNIVFAPHLYCSQEGFGEDSAAQKKSPMEMYNCEKDELDICEPVTLLSQLPSG